MTCWAAVLLCGVSAAALKYEERPCSWVTAAANMRTHLSLMQHRGAVLQRVVPVQVEHASLWRCITLDTAMPALSACARSHLTMPAGCVLLAISGAAPVPGVELGTDWRTRAVSAPAALLPPPLPRNTELRAGGFCACAKQAHTPHASGFCLQSAVWACLEGKRPNPGRLCPRARGASGTAAGRSFCMNKRMRK